MWIYACDIFCQSYRRASANVWDFASDDITDCALDSNTSWINPKCKKRIFSAWTSRKFSWNAFAHCSRKLLPTNFDPLIFQNTNRFLKLTVGLSHKSRVKVMQNPFFWTFCRQNTARLLRSMFTKKIKDKLQTLNAAFHQKKWILTHWSVYQNVFMFCEKPTKSGNREPARLDPVCSIQCAPVPPPRDSHCTAHIHITRHILHMGMYAYIHGRTIIRTCFSSQ